MDRDADEQVVGQRAAARELRRASRRIDAGHEMLGQHLDVSAASASRNISETSPVTGTGRCIGNVDVICTESRMPR